MQTTTTEAMDPVSFNSHLLENRIRQSDWWAKAACTVDSHYSNTSGIMLTHHLEAVYNNVEDIFNQPETGFYGRIFALLKDLKLNKNLVKKELKIVSLLHDIGKTAEDKSQIIPHPLTGKPAHLRHGIAGLMATMEIIGEAMTPFPQQQNSIYRTVELHDISYGLFREFNETGILPSTERLQYISNKIHLLPGAGFMYLLIFKLADIHGHANIADVIWFYNIVKENYFGPLQIHLPVPEEKDIR
jgi:hypothetical protein